MHLQYILKNLNDSGFLEVLSIFRDIMEYAFHDVTTIQEKS